MKCLPPRPPERGIALVITLSAIILLSALILAFFSNATLHRQISFSGVNQTRADQVARAGLEIVVGGLRDEAADPAYSKITTGSGAAPAAYFPIDTTSVLPRKVGVSGTTCIVKLSGANSVIDPGTNQRNLGSSISIDTASRNGRCVTASRWFGTGGPGLGSSDTLPTWVYVTRSGVQTPPLDEAATPSANGYVVGRFAYAVYETGGLMDANAAGYPSAASAVAPWKASLGAADLSALGLSSALPEWRNLVTGSDAATFQEWSSGLRRTSGSASIPGLASAASGHLETASGDNVFLSRHDLLQTAQKGLAGLESTQTPLLAHFSRAFNGPSWSPSTVSTANPNPGTFFFSTDTALTHYDDLGVALTTTVPQGSVLLRRRFSLAKVSWITSAGPASGISDAAIQACFGLKWNAPNWDYVGASGSARQSSIATLDQVAAQNREPNFFELLKAGISAGSLGRSNDNQTFRQDASGSWDNTLDQSKDQQVFQIGANIIDCAGSDNFPTTLAYAVGSTTLTVHGVKDLPYLYGVLITRLTNIAYVDATYDQMKACALAMVPFLFNPHASGGASAASGPSKVRIRIAAGMVKDVWMSNFGTNSSAPLARMGANVDLTACPSIEVSSTSAELYRAAMKPVKGGEATSGTTLLKNLLGSAYITSGTENHGFVYYVYSGLPQNYQKPTATTTIRTSCSDLMMVLEYLDAAGNWRVYDTLAGYDALTGAGSGIGGTNIDFGPTILPLTSGTTVRAGIDNSNALFKLDPRTTRFGVALSSNCAPGVTAPVSGGGGVSWQALYSKIPFGSGLLTQTTATSGCFPGGWLLGGTNQWSDNVQNLNVADLDGTVRPADGWLSGNANLFASMGDGTRRPVILHRPYASVAELGYVFRGSPWKTLNFFDGSSGDGALLDFFSVSDEPEVLAGRVNLNSSLVAVQKALLSGVGQASTGTAALGETLAGGIASAYQTYAGAAGAITSTLPKNVAEIPAFMSSTLLGSAYPTSSYPIKYYRESVARSLTAGTQTRTWNFLIDVVGQVGRFPTGKTPASLADFVVEGERRYWLSVAVDRYTGKVIDQQLEPVNE
ncbi:MAG: hypothetical protein ACFUZC_12825 [Chthoniobacteraceae bacterium]